MVHKSFFFNRDITIRGRDIEGVIKQYSSMVKPAYCNYIAPTMVHADIIVPRGGDNKVAIQLIVQHVHTQLQLVGVSQNPTFPRKLILNFCFSFCFVAEGFQIT